MRELNRPNSLAFVNAKQRVRHARPIGLSRLSKKLGLNSKDKKGNKEVNPKKVLAKKILVRTGIVLSLTFLFTLLVGTIFLIGIVSAYSKNLPKIEDIFAKVNDSAMDTVIYDRTGTKELYRLQGTTLKERVYINEVPHKLKWAFLAAEDDRFYSHNGIDLFGLSRVVICHIKSRGTDPTCGGGSSITQQVVKNATGDKKYDMERKIREAVLAMKTEEVYEKDEILEFYLNVVAEGGILQGVKAGSKHIFQKENLNDLTLAEIAYLAAIPNQPNIFSPCGGSFDSDGVKARAEYILGRMLILKNETGVTQEEIDQAKEDLNKPITCALNINKKAPHFVDYVIGKDLKNAFKNNDEGKDGIEYLRGKGYKVITSVDLDIQDALQDSIRTSVKSKEFQDKIGAQNAGAVMMDPRTGDVLAMVGSRDFNEESNDPRFKPQDNVTTATGRSLGSIMKVPLYLAAFTKGYYPSSVIPDVCLQLNRPSTKCYPDNYSRGFEEKGQFISMRDGLRWSLNMPAATTYLMTGGDTYGEILSKISGWEGSKEAVKNLSAPLGAEVPLIHMVHAFATLANEGVYNTERTVLQVLDNQGNVVYDNTKVEGKQVIEKKHAFLINDMNQRYWLCDKDLANSDPLLKEVNKTMNFACKTGTSDNEKGAPATLGFIGYTPTFVLGMWGGNNCGVNECPIMPGNPSVRGAGAHGENLYYNLYKPFLKDYYKKIEPAKFNVPAGVRRVDICSVTGRAWTEDCALLPNGTKVQDWAADTGLPPAEDMIKKVMVTECGGSYKLARPIDIQLGLAQEKAYFVYKYPVEWVQAQITKFQTDRGQLPPTEVCNIERTRNKPQVIITTPSNRREYEPGKTINVEAVATSDVGIAKVEIFLNGVLQQTLTNVPYTVSFSAPSGEGEYRITVVATDTTGLEGEDEKIIVVQSAPASTPTPTQVFISVPTPTPTKKP